MATNCKSLKQQSFAGYYAPEKIRRRLESTKRRAQQLEELLAVAERVRKTKSLKRQREKTSLYEKIARWRDDNVPWQAIGRRVGLTRQGAQFVYERFKKQLGAQ